MLQKVAIIGATGMLGRPVTRQLIKAGFSVTILSRNKSNAQSLFPEAEVAEADARDQQGLQHALQGQQALYLNLNVDQSVGPGGWQTEREGLASILEAAKAAGIQRVCFISSVVMNYQGMNGFNWWIFDMKKQAVKMVKESGIPYLIFYPSTFMESFPYIYRQGKQILLAGKSKCPMWYIAGDDYGRQVAKALRITPEGESREYTVQGREPFTADEAARIFIETYGKEKLRISQAPLGLLKFLSRFSHKINYGAHIVEALNNYPEKFESEKTWNELGKPEIRLRDFAASLD